MIDFEIWLDAELKNDWFKRTGGKGKDKPLPRQQILPIGSDAYERELGGNTIKKNCEFLLAAHEKQLDNLALTSALNVKERNTRGRSYPLALGYFLNAGNNVAMNTQKVGLFSAPYSNGHNIPMVDTRHITPTVYESKYREFAQSILHFSDCLTIYICTLSKKDVTLHCQNDKTI